MEGVYAGENADFSEASEKFIKGSIEACNQKKAAGQIHSEMEFAECGLAPMRSRVTAFMAAYNKFSTSYLQTAKALDDGQINPEKYPDIIASYAKEVATSFKNDLRTVFSPFPKPLPKLGTEEFAGSYDYARESGLNINYTLKECNAKRDAKQINTEVEKTQCVLAPMTEKVNAFVSAYNKYEAASLTASKALDAKQITNADYTNRVKQPQYDLYQRFYDLRRTFTE